MVRGVYYGKMRAAKQIFIFLFFHFCIFPYLCRAHLLTLTSKQMKKLILMLAASAMLTACEAPAVLDEEAAEEAQSAIAGKTKKFTFTLKGDFSDDWKPVTRGYLQADGKELTDVWVLDYDGEGNLLQQLHQGDNTAEDFGKPVMQLTYGAHHVYFIASRGVNPTLNTEAKTITFGTVRDTFWKDYSVDVVSTSNGNRAVTLDRVVTKLKLSFTDAVAEGAATFNITPATWYYGWNYVTGVPVAAASSQTVTVNIPASEIGSSATSVSIFSFSTAAEWQTDVTLNSKTSADEIIGQATIPNVPLKANRVTEYSGPIFGTSGTATLSLNSEWAESTTGTW